MGLGAEFGVGTEEGDWLAGAGGRDPVGAGLITTIGLATKTRNREIEDINLLPIINTVKTDNTHHKPSFSRLPVSCALRIGWRCIYTLTCGRSGGGEAEARLRLVLL